jgi:uncharacterized membrane protein (UPF0127 family)
VVTRLTILLCIFLTCSGCASSTPATTINLNIEDETFTLELITTQETRTNGMMHRTSIAPKGGMLFVFPDTANRSFWMKNCFVDIDLIFLDSRGIITTLYEMTIEPPRKEVESDWQYEGRLKNYWSQGPARFAIELAAGSIERLHLEINQKIALDLPYVKSLAR